MRESYPPNDTSSSPAPPKLLDHSRDPFQFSLAWLVFWTTICAIGAGMVRQFLARGDEGVDSLIIVVALGIWLALTGLAIWHRVFARHRWENVKKLRGDLEALVRQRRAQLRDQKTDCGQESVEIPTSTNQSSSMSAE